MSLKQFELFRLMPSSKITVNTVVSGGGNLRVGAYQFSYQLIDEYSGRSTKFALFTLPINISVSDTSGDKSAPINSLTDKSIEVSFNISEEESTLYTSYRIAVIESKSAIGQSSVVSLTDQISFSSGKNVYVFSNNEFVNRVGIEALSVDDAAIHTFKTLSFKNNKLIGGNVKYKNLSLDNGDPFISSGSIIKRKIPFSGNTDKSLSESRGYFLDEVYRFYISFWDEYGDFSFPYPLNMANVSGNTSEAFNGFRDMKFPKRDKDNKIIETFFRGLDNEYSVSVNSGLRLTVNNIPTWAKGFVVLRAKRRKGVLFQSPLIPTTIIQSPDAESEYPGEGAGAPNPLGTILPKNMSFSLNKAIVRKQGIGISPVDWSANYTGFEFCKRIHVSFPPEMVFNNSGVPYSDFIKNERVTIDAIDYCGLEKGAHTLLSRNLSLPGSDLNHANDGSRSSASTMVASGDYAYASHRLSRSEFTSQIESTQRTVTDEVVSMSSVPNGLNSVPIIGIGSSAPTSDFGNHDDLKITPDGPYNGTTPSNQRCVVIATKGDRPDLSYYGVQGVKAGYTTSNVVNYLDPLTGNPTGLNPEFIRDVDGIFSNPPYSTTGVNCFLEIVNFRSSLGDDRYGLPFSQNEIVSTGSIVNFESSPSSFVIDVFGGDCNISPFTFKVYDSHYAVVNSALWGDDGKGFGASFKDGDNKQIRRPFPYKSSGYNIGIYLESEVNSFYSEDFATKGRDSDYDIISPIISPWSGEIVRGSFYSYENKIYRALVNDVSGSLPKLTVGYLFEDLGRNLNGSYYNIKSPADLFFYSKSFNENKTPLQYLYSPDFSIVDMSKPFPIVFNKERINRIDFSSRIVYSETGILQANIESFNRFRVGNFFDLEESNGSLTKLIDHKGNLYGVQSNAFSYIPFESNLIETSDGISLSVQSSQIVGKPQQIESYGTDYIRTVISTPRGLMFGDFDNSKIIMFEGGVRYLNDLGVSKYIQTFSKSLEGLEISDRASQFYYDYSVDDIVFKMGNQALVLGPNDVIKTKIVPNANWDYGMYQNSNHYAIGNSTNNFSLSEINSNLLNKNFLGSPFTSSIKFVLNEEGFFTRMFYLIKFLANKEEFVTIEALSNNGQRSFFSDTTEQDRWAGFLLNKIRDNTDKKRLRGEYAIVTSTVESNEISTALSKLQAAYRMI